jgi:hypothetical protein
VEEARKRKSKSKRDEQDWEGRRPKGNGDM